MAGTPMHRHAAERKLCSNHTRRPVTRGLVRTHEKMQRGDVAAWNLIEYAETFYVTQHKLGGDLISPRGMSHGV